jgi:hypothetical protein
MDERKHSVFLGATAQAALPPAMNERNYFEMANEREQKYQDLILKNLQKKAQAFGLQLVPKSQDKEGA